MPLWTPGAWNAQKQDLGSAEVDREGALQDARNAHVHNGASSGAGRPIPLAVPRSRTWRCRTAGCGPAAQKSAGSGERLSFGDSQNYVIPTKLNYEF